MEQSYKSFRKTATEGSTIYEVHNAEDNPAVTTRVTVDNRTNKLKIRQYFLRCIPNPFGLYDIEGPEIEYRGGGLVI